MMVLRIQENYLEEIQKEKVPVMQQNILVILKVHSLQQ